MKAKILVLSILILMQSCTSYKAVDIKKKPLVEGKTYKFIVNDSLVKGNLTRLNDTIAVFKVGEKTITMNPKKLKYVEKQKIDGLKSFGLIAGIVGVTLTAATISIFSSL